MSLVKVLAGINVSFTEEDSRAVFRNRLCTVQVGEDDFSYGTADVHISRVQVADFVANDGSNSVGTRLLIGLNHPQILRDTYEAKIDVSYLPHESTYLSDFLNSHFSD